jgi:hypothetical protein
MALRTHSKPSGDTDAEYPAVASDRLRATEDNLELAMNHISHTHARGDAAAQSAIHSLEQARARLGAAIDDLESDGDAL